MQGISVDLATVTPLFMGGAPRLSEFRSPPSRGALFWAAPTAQAPLSPRIPIVARPSRLRRPLSTSY